MDRDDHELLARMEERLIAIQRDSAMFSASVVKRLDGHDGDIKFTNTIVYGCIGAFVFLEFIIKVIGK